jgi:hypothetical protein
MSDVASPDLKSASQPSLVNEWLSVEAAALRLGISSRSIARRIQNGQLESRVDVNGRRTVLICTPAPAPEVAPEPAPQEAASQDARLPQDGPRDGGIEPSQARELAQQAMSIVIRTHEQTLMTARAEMLIAQRSSRRAWAAAAMLLVGASITVGVVTHHLTQAAALVKQAQDRVEQTQQQVQVLTSERDRMRELLVQARIDQAQAQGQLAGMTIKPTTAPSVAQRFATILFGE